MIDSFKQEFIQNCTAFGRHWKEGDQVCLTGNHYKHGKTLIKCVFNEPDEFKVQNIISFDPYSANKTVVFLCKLADKHQVYISGKLMPNLVGPSISGKSSFISGLNAEKLLKWYEYYGFEMHETENGKYVKRSPKHET